MQTPAVSPGGGSRAGEEADYGIQAFLVIRARFFLAYRLTLRMNQLAAPDGGASTPGWRLVLAAFVVLDIAQWALLRRPQRFAFKTRLALDSLDIALWSLAPYGAVGRYDMAVYAAAPLAVEAGLRLRARGLVVPAVTLVVTAVVRSVLGLPVSLVPFLWLMPAVGGGVVLAHYLGRLHRRVDDEWSQRRSAEERRAFLAGQNAVAMGASSVVDGIEGVVNVLGPPPSGSVLCDFSAAWKARLYQSTAGHAVYLADALGEWSRAHNRHPDLSSRVELNLPEGFGTTLLTSDQATVLHQMLSGLELRGLVAIEPHHPAIEHRPPGGSIALGVGGLLVAVPADVKRLPRAHDPGPAVFLIGSFLMLADAVGVPLPPWGVLPQLVLALTCSWWADRALRRRGIAARPRVMAGAVVVAVSHTVVATLTMRSPLNAGGMPNYIVPASMDILGLLGGVYWQSLERGARWILPTGVVLVPTLAWLLHPVAGDALYLVLQTGWLLPFLLSGLKLAPVLERGAARYAQSLASTDAAAETVAFLKGQATVIELVRQAWGEAEEQLSRVVDILPVEILDNVRRRLEEVDRRLEQLTVAGSLLSTTTSSPVRDSPLC